MATRVLVPLATVEAMPTSRRRAVASEPHPHRRSALSQQRPRLSLGVRKPAANSVCRICKMGVE